MFKFASDSPYRIYFPLHPELKKEKFNYVCVFVLWCWYVCSVCEGQKRAWVT